MSNNTSSCYPDRLEAFAKSTNGIWEGLASRAGKLGEAVDHYAARCAGPQRIDCTGAAQAVRIWADQVRSLGEFAGAVAAVFATADGASLKHETSHPAQLSTTALNDWLPAQYESDAKDPGASSPFVPIPGLDLDDVLGDGNKRGALVRTWLDDGSLALTVLSSGYSVVVNETEAGGGIAKFLAVGTNASTAIGGFLDSASGVLSPASGFADEWFSEPDASTPFRAVDATAVGAGAFGAMSAGNELGDVGCALVAPEVSPACGPVGAGVAGLMYAFGGEHVVDKATRWFDHAVLDEPIPAPNEHDVGAISDELRQPHLDPELDGSIATTAGRLAESDVANEVVLDQRLQRSTIAEVRLLVGGDPSEISDDTVKILNGHDPATPHELDTGANHGN